MKNPERVETMMMLMSLFLLVYNLGQRQLRISLKNQKATVKNQLNQPTEAGLFHSKCKSCMVECSIKNGMYLLP